jgi:hypothetical protein
VRAPRFLRFRTRLLINPHGFQLSVKALDLAHEFDAHLTHALGDLVTVTAIRSL